MAILTASQLAICRQQVAANGVPINFNKATINAAIQAVEDWWVANQPIFGTAIDTATVPVVLTAAQKQSIAKAWLKSRFDRGN